MIIGVPREIKTEENRVALTPSGVGAFVAHGHTVVVEHDAGGGSSFPDALYRKAGARLAGAAKTNDELIRYIREKKPGDTILLKVFRKDSLIDLKVTLGERPKRK